MHDYQVQVNTSKQRGRVVGYRCFKMLANDAATLSRADSLKIKYEVSNYLKEEVTEIVSIQLLFPNSIVFKPSTNRGSAPTSLGNSK